MKLIFKIKYSIFSPYIYFRIFIMDFINQEWQINVLFIFWKKLDMRMRNKKVDCVVFKILEVFLKSEKNEKYIWIVTKAYAFQKLKMKYEK